MPASPPQQPGPTRYLPALLLLFGLSGCSALIYEIVWYQLLQLVIGSTAVSLGVLLATFMGGLCLGSLALPRVGVARRMHPLRVYAYVELGIGAAAVREFSDARRAGRPFDLVILDLTIPGGMGGRETMEIIRRIDARVPAIVSSGYSSDAVLADFRSFGFQAMVAKPYEIDQLTGTVKQVLAQRD